MALACTIHGLQSHSYIPPPPIESVQSIIIFDKDEKSFQPGEVITGRFVVTSVPKNSPEINGLALDLIGSVCIMDSLKDTKEVKNIVQEKKYFYGNGIRKMGTLKEGEYKFAYRIPEDAPCTFSNGKFGWIRYTVNCVAHQTNEGYFDFKPKEEIYVTAKVIPLWKNYKFYIQPMFARKQVSTFMLSGKIDLWLTTEQKCYQPGDQLKFVFRVKNASGKNVRAMTLQLVQIVNYASGGSKMGQNEKMLIPETITEGPNVPIDFTQVWNGLLNLPSYLQPSIDESGCIPTPITFQYALRVTLQMAGSLIPNISEEFPIQIACPLEAAATAANSTSNRPNQFLNPNPQPNSVTQLGRRMSMVSLTPSLPDYDTAAAREATVSGTTRTGSQYDLRPNPPPSYSCLDLNSQLQ